MPKQNDYTLNEEDLEQIQEAMNSPKGQIAKRATVLHSLHLGYAPEEIAQMQNLALTTVYNHYNRFKAEGIEGLPDKTKSGRPPKASKEYIALLNETLERNPYEMGYAFTIWTQARLRQFLFQETEISLSRSRFQDLMQRLGYRYRRPKYDLKHKQDADLREQVKAALDDLKKEPKQAKLSYSLWTKL